VSFFYYLRLIKIMYFDTSDKGRQISDIISFSNAYASELSVPNVYRFWRVSFISIFLCFYRFIIQKPALFILSEILTTLY
jgi:hypothetical protein